MKKFTSTTGGGAPIYKGDLKEIFNDDIHAVLSALLSSFQSDSEGLVISGCVLTNNAGNFDMTAGIVYLDGEFMRVAAVTNQSFTKYIIQSNPVNDSRVFADGTTNVVAITKGAEVNAVASGVDYLTISSLTSLDDRRLSRFMGDKELKVNRAGNDTITGILTVNGGVTTDNVSIKHKKLTVTDWDMVTDPSYALLHGLTASKILDVSILIQDNAVGKYSRLESGYGGTDISGSYIINNTEIEMYRVTGETYDNAAYVNTTIKVLITYEP